MAWVGVEPTTFVLWGRHSIHWATAPCIPFVYPLETNSCFYWTHTKISHKIWRWGRKKSTLTNSSFCVSLTQLIWLITREQSNRHSKSLSSKTLTVLEQGIHQNGDQAARRPHIFCGLLTDVANLRPFGWNLQCETLQPSALAVYLQVFGCLSLLSTRQLSPNFVSRCAHCGCKWTKIFSAFALCLMANKFVRHIGGLLPQSHNLWAFLVSFA